MASIVTTFEKRLNGSANSASKDVWYDIGTLSEYPGDSPIQSGHRLILGYLDLSSQDKALNYELRVNNPGESLGTTAKTSVVSFAATDPTTGTVRSDLYQYGNIQSVAPVSVLATGTEKLWLRVMSGSNVVATFNWFLYYTKD